MHPKPAADDQITLTAAAKLAPGRPSTNCMWRWCRRGVKARDGQRIRLQHTRVGGKIFTCLTWLEAFGRQLADADAKYFDLCETAAQAAAAAEPPMPRRRRRTGTAEIGSGRRAEITDAMRELAEAGIR